jgi:hypothetical protein
MTHGTLETVDGRPALRFERTLLRRCLAAVDHGAVGFARRPPGYFDPERCFDGPVGYRSYRGESCTYASARRSRPSRP